jgi:PhnB protein
MNTLTPKLIVRGAADAIAFYVEVFGAREQERYEDDGRIVNATLTLGKSSFALADETPQWHNHAPVSLGGTPVILTLDVKDPDAVCARAVARGAKVIFPVADQSYGHRAGRIQDPFGHVWILDKPL